MMLPREVAALLSPQNAPKAALPDLLHLVQ